MINIVYIVDGLFKNINIMSLDYAYALKMQIPNMRFLSSHLKYSCNRQA